MKTSPFTLWTLAVFDRVPGYSHLKPKIAACYLDPACLFHDIWSGKFKPSAMLMAEGEEYVRNGNYRIT